MAATAISPCPTKDAFRLPKPTAAARAGVHYDVEAADLHAHLLQVTPDHCPARRHSKAVPARVDSRQLPGARICQKPAEPARPPRPQARVSAAADWTSTPGVADCQARPALVLTYEVCAYDTLVRTAWLDAVARLFQRHQPVPAGAWARAATSAPWRCRARQRPPGPWPRGWLR